MAQQTKFGLLLVCVLTGVFGVLVYKRLHKPADLAAGTDPAAVAAADGQLPDESAPEASLGPSAELLATPAPSRPQPEKPAPPASVPSSDPFGEQPVAQARPSAATITPRLRIEEEEDFFAVPIAATPVTAGKIAAPVQSEPDPFADETPSVQPVQAMPVRSDNAAEVSSQDPAFDPFATETAGVSPQKQPLAAPIEEADPFADDPMAAESTTMTSRSPEADSSDPVLDAPTIPVQAEPVTPSAADTFQDSFAAPAVETKTATTQPAPLQVAAPAESWEDPFAAPEPKPVPTNPAATAKSPAAVEMEESVAISPEADAPRAMPALPLDPLDTLPEPTPAPQSLRVTSAPPQSLPLDLDAPTTSSARSVPLAAPVGGYIVEPNDNFWTISKKLYGTGRYFQALADHNRAIVPDPAKMRPGLQLAAPSVAELEARYPHAISAGPASEVQQLSGTQPLRTQSQASPGFFIADDGQAMYRVAAEDTLSGIAYAHLGRASRWVQILEMNRSVLKDGNTLKIGAELRLPADASRVQLTPANLESR